MLFKYSQSFSSHMDTPTPLLPCRNLLPQSSLPAFSLPTRRQKVSSLSLMKQLHTGKHEQPANINTTGPGHRKTCRTICCLFQTLKICTQIFPRRRSCWARFLVTQANTKPKQPGWAAQGYASQPRARATGYRAQHVMGLTKQGSSSTAIIESFPSRTVPPTRKNIPCNAALLWGLPPLTEIIWAYNSLGLAATLTAANISSVGKGGCWQASYQITEPLQQISHLLSSRRTAEVDQDCSKNS